jgi:hypothetical protein
MVKAFVRTVADHVEPGRTAHGKPHGGPQGGRVVTIPQGHSVRVDVVDVKRGGADEFCSPGVRVILEMVQ